MNKPYTLTAFPESALNFLQDLSENNNREWFDAHKKRYQEDLQAPAIALVETIGMRLQEHFPNVSYDTAVNGSGSLMRIYRDTRFSKDKTPYKDRIAMGFPENGGKKMAAPSFGLQISSQEAGLMAGVFGFSKEQLNQYRDAVSDAKQGQALLDAIAAVQERGEYIVSGQHYKRVPRGYSELNDERDPYLLHDGLWVSYPTIPREVIVSEHFVDTVIAHFVAMRPVQAWLVEIFS